MLVDYLPSRDLVLATVLALSILSWAWQLNARRNAPPGPIPFPIFGNLLQMSLTPWKPFSRWGKIYGPVTFATIFGQRLFIINDHNAASEILDQNSTWTTSRPYIPMATMSGWGDLLPMVPAGKRLRQIRANLHKGIGASALTKYENDMQRSAAIFIYRLLQHPHDALRELRRAMNTNMGRITYGLELSPTKAPFVELTERALQSFEYSTRPGRWPVDAFPNLRHIPSWIPLPFVRLAKQWRTGVVQQVTEQPLQSSLNQIAQGNAQTSLVADLMPDHIDLKNDAEALDLIKWTATASYLGGSDTSISTLSTFILAMVLHPDIQRKAQAEIDSVVGSDRLPEFTDRPSLPYAECILKELYRWQPPAPMVFPHLVDKSFTYKGWVIPQGSFIIPNVWGMLKENDVYENPDEFRPERHLDGSVLDPTGPTFGYGRRVCPGAPLATRSLWMFIVTMLATVDFNCQTSPDGAEIKPRRKYNELPVQQPCPFPNVARPRNSMTAALIDRALWH